MTLPKPVSDVLARVPDWESDGQSHFLTGLEPGLQGMNRLVELAVAVRTHADELSRSRPLAGKCFAGMFFDPSLRTRLSMHVACAKLGAEFLEMQQGSGMWTLEFADEVTMDGVAAEHVYEAAGVLGRYADVVGLRAFPTRGQWERERTQPVHQAFASHTGAPLVNLEGPFAHPCQGLADAITLRDLLGNPRGRRVVVTWAPHPRQLPVATPQSAIWAAASEGAEVVLAHPDGFELDPAAMKSAADLASEAGGSFEVTSDRDTAFAGADVVYAKSWGALGGPAATVSGHADAFAALRDWTVTTADLHKGAPAQFMHCLPVRRNVVVASDVLEGPLSRVLDQADNRIWGQAALMLALVGR